MRFRFFPVKCKQLYTDVGLKNLGKDILLFMQFMSGKNASKAVRLRNTKGRSSTYHKI